MTNQGNRKSEDTYFSKSLIHRTVEDFCVKFIENQIQVNTLKTIQVEEEYQEIIEYPEGFFSSLTASETLRREGRIPLVRPAKRTVSKNVEDERFTNLKDYVMKYSRQIQVPEETRQEIKRELYSTIILLKQESRIVGDFSLKPQLNIELDHINEKLQNLEDRMESTNKLVTQVFEDGMGKGKDKMICPDCKRGKIYEKIEAETGITQSKCYACGYYEDNSEGYSESSIYLFRKWFPTEVKWLPSPEIDRRCSSPEELTIPQPNFIIFL